MLSNTPAGFRRLSIEEAKAVSYLSDLEFDGLAAVWQHKSGFYFEEIADGRFMVNVANYSAIFETARAAARALQKQTDNFSEI